MPDEALAFQLNACRQLCRVLGITEMASNIFEADDLIGGVASKVRQANGQPVFVSRDKDLIQLVQASDLYWDFGKSQPKTQSELELNWILAVIRWPTMLALMGDSSDSIAGVPGIGAKTARQLLSHYPGIDAIMEHLDQLQDLPIRGAAKKLADKLNSHRDQLFLALQLATIVTDVDEMRQHCRGLVGRAFIRTPLSCFAMRWGLEQLLQLGLTVLSSEAMAHRCARLHRTF